ncbi:MAG: putative nucleoside-diphosphate sugar epimerase [Rhizobium sp.]|nr:putative nucleoside-diphosphate sugar epimerase [Rhizobium sp.]
MGRGDVTAQAGKARADDGQLAASGKAGPTLSTYNHISHRIYGMIRKRVSTCVYSVRRSPGLFFADISSAVLALFFAFALRYSIDTTDTAVLQPDIVNTLLRTGPWYIGVCALIFPLSGLYSRNWRYGSVSDLLAIVRAVALTTVILVCVLFFATRLQDIPRSAILIDALLLTAFLAASRLSFRLDELRLLGLEFGSAEGRKEKRIPTLVIGAGDAADLYLRAIRCEKNCPYSPVAILDATTEHKGKTLRDVPIMGSIEEFRAVVDELKHLGQFPRHIVFTEAPVTFGEARAAQFLNEAEEMGITVSRLSQLTELRNAKGDNRFELRAIELTDLLERPQASLDHAAIDRLVRGRRVLITGAGGSIGSELTLQIASCEPAEIILIENSEYNLYAIDMELAERFSNIPRTAHICNVRRAKRVSDIFDRHMPELVFHAAALKHVPMVELNPCEGVLTNVIGTMNVANAAKRSGVLAMVQISTDKVVNPTSFMGATKRLAELYCQALDLSGFESHHGPRFMTVRFGNVLGSSGSLIPLFKRQLAAGGPLTVTDAEMTRFFMTIREAVQLTLQASSYGLEGEIGQGEIFVLDMGEPIKIIDIARRMIMLAGLTADVDIKIKIIGLRPGEKLYEELFDTAEQRVPSPVPSVLGAVPSPMPLALLEESFARLQLYAEIGEETTVLQIVNSLIPGYERKLPPVSKTFVPVLAAGNENAAVPAASDRRFPGIPGDLGAAVRG